MPDKPEIPEDITGLDRAQLAELEGKLLERFEELKTQETSDDVTREMSEIAETLPALGERVDAIDHAAAQRDAAETAVQQAQQRREAQEQREHEAAQSAETSEPTPVADITPEPDTAQVEEPIAASSSSARPSVADIATRAPEQNLPATDRSEWFRTLTAGAELPGLAAGSQFGSGGELVDALLRRTESIAVSSGQRSAMVARANIDALGTPVARADSSGHATRRMLSAIEDFSKRGPNRDVLTADGGWCAPSETLYELCEPEVADQLISLPEIPITRGGIQFFKSPDMSEFSEALWGFCEDELIDGVEKPCVEVPCPDPEEVRACVEGACLTTGILTAKAFPEWVERYVRGVMVAHAIRISAATIARMEEGSISVVYDEDAPMLQGSAFTASLLNTVEYQVEDLKAAYFLGEGDRPVVVLPRWVRGIVRADLANRMGVDLLRISDDYIDSLFYDRGVGRIQWIKGWQTEHVGTNGDTKAWPEQVRFLVYREGAWVRGLEPVIEIETMYDSELIKRNKMTRLFTEQAFLVANLCTDSRVVTLPVCPSGATHCGNTVSCFIDQNGNGEGENGE